MVETGGAKPNEDHLGRLFPGSFHWIIKDRLAGACTPYVSELSAYARMGFDTIVCLQEGIPDDSPAYKRGDVEAAGMELLHIPVKDFSPLQKEEFDLFVRYMRENPKKKVMVHCYAGQGRTGSALAAYLGKSKKLTGSEAISRIRKIWDYYIATDEQVKAVLDYLNRR